MAALAAVSSLAACTTGGRGTRPEAGPAKPVEQPTRVTEMDRQKIAVLVPTTGANAALGQSIANAANLALLDSGNQQIKLTIYNTAGGAALAAQRALADGNRLFLGPLLAPDVRAVQAISRAANVPILSFSNDAALAGNGHYEIGRASCRERVCQYV